MKLTQEILKSQQSNPYQYHMLKNGIRIVHRRTESTVSHLALMTNLGSRDEEEHENGLAHLIEHMIFKGTAKRSAFHVISFLENVGCDLNAYTTKEEICIHGTFLHHYYKRAMELFSDIAFHSVFPSKDLEKEKEVIIDEINSYKDSPAEEIFDEFENLLYQHHPIGRNILGTAESLHEFSRVHLLRFIRKNLNTNNMVLASVGNIAFNKLIFLAEKFFEPESLFQQNGKRIPPKNYKAQSLKLERDTYLTHSLTGNLAYSYTHPRRLSLELLNNILGGPMLNSRLNRNIREKYGFAYSLLSTYTSYSDTGWMGIYSGTDPKTAEKTLKLVHKELQKLREDALGTLQLSRAKQQLIVLLAIGYESGLQEALAVGRALLFKEYADSFEDIVKQINALTSMDLLEAANEVFDPKQLSSLFFINNNSE